MYILVLAVAEVAGGGFTEREPCYKHLNDTAALPSNGLIKPLQLFTHLQYAPDGECW